METRPTEPALYVEPTPGVAKTIGTLHLVFGSLLLLCVGCSGAYMLMLLVMMPAMRPMMEAQRQQFELQFETQRQAKIDALRKQEDAAEDELDKQQLRDERKALEAQPTPTMPDMTRMWGADDPRVLGYALSDVSTALMLNLMMVIAGIGLLRLREWGRVLGLWVAWLKIARLLVVYAVFAFAVVPVIAKGYGEMVDEMMKSMPAGNAPAQPMGPAIAAMYGTMLAIYAVAMILLGAIYPAVSLWYLTRPGTKAACRTPAEPRP